ncbi:Cu-Zn family superoxide dismutase [Saccharothrix carnea]|uniref:Cu-Zn family superoxide dismutase n=1 Tax=Saccharothrix carnea TaxID=1280637 RepID=A0A2P8I954_SACCR|nr:superoxide dismutase [Saccharothrix carnea]PSL55006.1 Cu-Zn family superoxide dismutase [Saccharothrix carnea]
MHLAVALALVASFTSVSGELTSYDARVPAGARAEVVAGAVDGGTVVLLRTSGLLPNREYGAHAHVNPCGPAPADAGPHYQHVQGGATDPAFANPRNEIWLDFTTDEHGRGSAMTRVPWEFGERRAGSIVLHEEHTHTEPGQAGTAGARVGCLTVPF